MAGVKGGAEGGRMMEDIRIVVDRALSSTLSIPVMAEELIDDEMPDEYITYYIIREVPLRYANGKPIAWHSMVEVNFFCHNLNRKTTVPTEIANAMIAVGFSVSVRQEDVEYNTGGITRGTGLYVTSQDFILERVDVP